MDIDGNILLDPRLIAEEQASQAARNRDIVDLTQTPSKSGISKGDGALTKHKTSSRSLGVASGNIGLAQASSKGPKSGKGLSGGVAGGVGKFKSSGGVAKSGGNKKNGTVASGMAKFKNPGTSAIPDIVKGTSQPAGLNGGTEMEGQTPSNAQQSMISGPAAVATPSAQVTLQQDILANVQQPVTSAPAASPATPAEAPSENNALVQGWLNAQATPTANQAQQPYDLSAYASFPAVAIPGARNNRTSTASTILTLETQAPVSETQASTLETQAPGTPETPQATPIPMTNAVHPPPNFRSIPYPNLPDAVAPFNADQTAHARSIIPPHVRAIVEDPPTIPNLDAKKTIRTGVSRGRTEPD